MSTQDKTTQLSKSSLRVAKVHFGLAALFAIQLIIYDAWGLLTPPDVLRRWLLLALLLVVTTVVWYLIRVSRARSASFFASLIFALITADIILASVSVYMQRGMASRAVALYAIPIITASVLYSYSAVMATALLCVAAYVATAVSYFVLNFNEGYKIELYGEVGFYAVSFIVLAALLGTVIRQKSDRS